MDRDLLKIIAYFAFLAFLSIIAAMLSRILDGWLFGIGLGA